MSILPQFDATKSWKDISAREMTALVKAVQDLQAVVGPRGRTGKATQFRHTPLRVVIVKEPGEDDKSLTVRFAGYADIPPDVEADEPFEWKSDDQTAYFDLGNTVEDYVGMWWPPEGGLPTLDTVFLDAYYDELTLRVQLPGESVPLPQFRFKKHEDDYLVCRSWDGEKEGEKDVLVAKDWLLRRSEFDFSRTGKLRDNIKYIYDEEELAHWERTAILMDEEGEEELWIEVQIVTPPYVVGDEDSITDVIEANTLQHPIVVTVQGEPDPVKLFLIHKTKRSFSRKFAV